MKYLFTLFYLSLFPFLVKSVDAQNSISAGPKVGLGYSIPTLAIRQSANGINYELRGNASYSLGFLGQYILGDRLGIESGTAISYQQFSRKDLKNSFKSLMSIDSSIGVINYQIPIQLFYKFSHPTNPYKYFKITSGISLDMLEVEFLYQQYNHLILSKYLVEFRMGNEGKRYGRFEYGLQYQCSIGGYHNFPRSKQNASDSLNIKYSIISFNLYYFFLNKDI
ncbi:MAG: hypothetical protein J7604_07200 [Sporocytophaga sp.]|uniref:hypothetical protein n=1 Tax=Sporocytophaga sp. TaxID=2231183 RepID=UPI001B2A263F|nr:hypothetical protein [Sporocytophaga sp.]MBO9699980.1 hypothetical protein [Sporocytophaga sp.]